MRTSFAITAAIATFVGSAFAADCNPSYNVAPSTECFTACNVKAGQKFVPGWTMDSKSELFIKSLTVMCDKSSSNYGSFMATGGMCMVGCAGEDPELFNAEWAGACAWWAEHKNDKCAADVTTTTTVKPVTTTTTTTTVAPTTTTTTVKPVTTTTTTAAAVTTTAAAGTTTASASTTTAAAGTTTAAPVTTTTTVTTAPTGAATVTVTVTVNACPTTAPGSCNNYNTIFGKKSGWGIEGDCCETQWDCTGSCFDGVCDNDHNPSKTCTVKKYFGKKNGKGPAGACCRTQRDCKADCRGGECTKN